MKVSTMSPLALLYSWQGNCSISDCCSYSILHPLCKAPLHIFTEVFVLFFKLGDHIIFPYSKIGVTENLKKWYHNFFILALNVICDHTCYLLAFLTDSSICCSNFKSLLTISPRSLSATVHSALCHP